MVNTATDTVLAGNASTVVTKGPYRKGDVMTGITLVIATPAGGFTMDVRAFPTQAAAESFAGGVGITRGPATLPAAMTGILPELPIEYVFTDTNLWIGVQLTADATGVRLSVWPRLIRKQLPRY